MSVSTELRTTTDLVKEILKKSPESRNSDNVLYYLVLTELGKRNGIDFEHMSVPSLFLHLKEYNFPQFESVRRTRQKIQSLYSELAGTDKVEAIRTLNEQAYKDYARKVEV